MISTVDLLAIFGEDNVLSDSETLDAYTRDMSFVPGVRPRCVVKAGDVGRIEKLVKLAAGTGTPLVPVSSGPLHFEGDTVPAMGGAVIVDLSGMKKVIHVDRINRVAMFEPGVTFEELTQALSPEGLRLNMPLLPRRTKSVAGSLLDRQPVLMPKYHWDIADPLACTEIVFGNGQVFRTGAAAGSGSIEEQWAAGGAQKEAAGPSASSWYRVIQGSQGTMGIVTWVSARCELKPSRQAAFFVPGNTLEKILETVHWLIRLKLVNECFILNNTSLGLIMASDNGRSHEQLKQDLPQWTLFFTIAAYELMPDERMDGQIADMTDLTQRLGVNAVTDLAGISSRQMLDAVQQPSTEPYWKIRHSGGCQDVYFLSTLDKLSALTSAMQAVADSSGHPQDRMGIYLQPVVQGGQLSLRIQSVLRPAESATDPTNQRPDPYGGGSSGKPGCLFFAPVW